MGPTSCTPPPPPVDEKEKTVPEDVHLERIGHNDKVLRGASHAPLPRGELLANHTGKEGSEGLGVDKRGDVTR